MTHQATGKVTSLTVRNLISKAGKAFSKHGVKLDSGQEFELDGFKQKYAVGDLVDSVGVAFKYKMWTETGTSGRGLPAMPSSATHVSPTTSGTASRPYASGGGRDVPFPIPQDNYQMAIIRQNALTNAVSLINAALGSCNADGKSSAGPVESMVDNRATLAIKVAYKLASFSSGHFDAIAAEEVAREVKGMLAKGAREEV